MSKNLDLSLQLLQTFIILVCWASIREKSFPRREEASVFKCMVHPKYVLSASKISTFKRPDAIALFYFSEKNATLYISQSAYFITWISKSFQGLMSALFSLVFSFLLSNPWDLLWHAFFSGVFGKQKGQVPFSFFCRRRFCASVLNCLWFKKQGKT